MTLARKGARNLVLAALLFTIAAPTAGDIGGCGQEIVDLDPEAFFFEKATIDCQKCIRCDHVTQACERACAGEYPLEFDEGCFPLVHDGEACLNALRAIACEDYGGVIDDVAPTIPTECNFCPLSERPTGAGGSS
ncbi:MAG: hypothetical protein FJ096_14935 [Deltaproteobacteria bacterium]|nr:hypothetical protein [Deltaproteobacteria bacterium]